MEEGLRPSSLSTVSGSPPKPRFAVDIESISVIFDDAADDICEAFKSHRAFIESFLPVDTFRELSKSYEEFASFYRGCIHDFSVVDAIKLACSAASNTVVPSLFANDLAEVVSQGLIPTINRLHAANDSSEFNAARAEWLLARLALNISDKTPPSCFTDCLPRVALLCGFQLRLVSRCPAVKRQVGSSWLLSIEARY